MSARAGFRQADLNRALKAAATHGLSIAGYEIGPDGTIRILTAQPGSGAPSPATGDSAWNEAMAKWRRSA